MIATKTDKRYADFAQEIHCSFTSAKPDILQNLALYSKSLFDHICEAQAVYTKPRSINNDEQVYQADLQFSKSVSTLFNIEAIPNDILRTLVIIYTKHYCSNPESNSFFFLVLQDEIKQNNLIQSLQDKECKAPRSDDLHQDVKMFKLSLLFTTVLSVVSYSFFNSMLPAIVSLSLLLVILFHDF